MLTLLCKSIPLDSRVRRKANTTGVVLSVLFRRSWELAPGLTAAFEVEVLELLTVNRVNQYVFPELTA